MHKEDYFLYSPDQCHVNGMILKKDPIEEIIKAIEIVHGKGYYCSKSIKSKQNIEPKNSFCFTYCEQNIMQLICHQLTTKQIAQKLRLSVRTVEDYRHKIQEKTGAVNVVGIAFYALCHQLISIEELDIFKSIQY
ncbi:MAG: response regulator transcription factor [Flavisolibacter sp.]